MNRKASLACRVREIREFLFGDHGVESLARALKISPATWLNFERGITMPAEVLVDFMEVTQVAPHWLSTGEGERFIEGTSSNNLDFVRRLDLRTW
jgi:hypothetical protein